MDFHAAMETFAEAWVAANMQNYVNTSDSQVSLKEISSSCEWLSNFGLF